jgi:glycosyltransferase involved in cell wall biosynthesis
MATLFLSFLALSISIMGTINKRDGIGRQSIELGMSLKNKYEVKVVPVGATEELFDEERGLLKGDFRKLNRIVVVNTSLPEIPHFVEIIKQYKREDQRFICYTMHESSFVDPHFVNYLNFFEHILVPDPFLIEVFQNSGVTAPISVIPLSVDLGDFLRQPIKEKIGDPFVFANYSACILRKDLELLILAFSKKFKNKENVKLRINCRGGDKHYEKKLRRLIEFLEIKNVEFTMESKTGPQYLRMFLSTDCYVSPSWGEGFSIQPRQAMALGLPVIVSNNTGQSTIAQSGLVFSLEKGEKIPAAYSDLFGFFDMGFMKKSDLDELADLMEKVYLKQHDLLKDSWKRREWASQFDLKKGPFIQKFCDFFEQFEENRG